MPRMFGNRKGKPSRFIIGTFAAVEVQAMLAMIAPQGHNARVIAYPREPPNS